MLQILRKHHFDLPKDPRIFLCSPTNYSIRKVAGRSYYYYGVEKAIRTLLNRFAEREFLGDTSCLSLQINVDGLPLFKSSKLQLWPILERIEELQNIGVFIIALFSGTAKPSSAQEYFADFIQEMKNLCKTGITIFEKNLRLKFSAVVCDAPARSFLKSIKSHSGYNSCERCVQQGEWENRLIFTQMNAPLRTDESFWQMIDDDHHLSVSPFATLDFGLVCQCALDYMHLVCLGVVRKVIFLWIMGPTRTRLHSNTIYEISSSLISLATHMPKNFARRPCSLTEAKMWKATEFRQFLLYTGPVVLSGKLKRPHFENFLLSVSMRLLLTHDTSMAKIIGESCFKPSFKTFLPYMANLFFLIMFITYCTLLMISRNMDHWTMWYAFLLKISWEILKKLIRQPTNPLAQILRRVDEKYDCTTGNMDCDKPKDGKSNLYVQHFKGPVPSGYEGFGQFRKYKSTNIFLTTLPGDSCVCIGNSVCVIKNILSSASGTINIVFSKFLNAKSFSSHPFDLKEIGLRLVSNLSTA